MFVTFVLTKGATAPYRKRILKIVLILPIALIAGCASNSGVVAMSQDTYFVSRQAATGFGGMSNLTALAYAEANQFCGEKSLVPKVTQQHESKPPYILGNYPRVDVWFQCITKESRPPIESFFK